MSADARTILVVDDEARIVDVVRSYLERAGYRVACAFDGKAALDAFREKVKAEKK
jgi:DNA-binding response OmpR family regulator